MKRIFETIIVGAGPAGLTAGGYLKKSIILDQKKEIGFPVHCAEGLSRRNLERVGIKPDPSWISTRTDVSKFFFPNGKNLFLFEKESGYVLDRPRFEKFLARECQGRIQLQTRIVDIKKESGKWSVVSSQGEIFRARHLIGADGPLSIVRQKVFREKIDFQPTIQFLVKLEKKIEPSEIRFYFDREKFPSGYAWFFPKSANLANIGIGAETNLKEAFDNFLQGTVKKEFGSYQLIEPRSRVLSLGGAKNRLFEDNAFLVGDAGGLADPIFGGGIGNAMISGKIAAELILQGRAGEYEKKLKSLPIFSRDLVKAAEIIYSLDNSVLNEAGELMGERKNSPLDLKNLSSLFLSSFLTKPNLTKNILKLSRLFLLYQKYCRSLVKYNL